MQEEIEHKTVNFAISTVKLSARTLLKGAQFFLRQYDKSASQGKQSMKRLIRQNRGVTNLEIEKTGIKDFDRYAKRYHIDYAIQKDLSCTPPRFLIFFKAQDADALNAAFKEYSAAVLNKAERPSVLTKLHDLAQVIANLPRQSTAQRGGTWLMNKKKFTKLLALYLPYLVIGLAATNLGESWRLAEGKELGDKIVSLIDTLPAAFANPLPSLHPLDILVGICCGAGLRLAVYLKSKNAKKYRHGMEYGSARWGTPADIAPFMAPKFEDNIILTKTERLMMSNRPPDPKNARNKNVLVVGGSGSGKTRYFIKPNLLQCTSKSHPVSFVVTDPKGGLIQECGLALLKNGYKIRTMNTINFHKSMRYNPFAYIHEEKDILKLVTTLMTNTKGEGQGGDPFWDKAERLLLTSLIAYLHYEAPAEEQNFATLLEMLNTMQVSEEDEDYQNPVDLLFEDLAKKKPNSFAGRQYKLYKLAAGKTAKSILISCGARLSPFDIQEIRDATMYDELELDKLGDRKTALFLIMSDTDSTFNFLISMIYSQLFNLLCDKADDVYGGKLPVHVRCLIDECANIGQIPQLEKLVATIRSREISACLVLQTRSQLKAIYKDNADTIVGNMDSQIFLGGSEPTTLKILPKHSARKPSTATTIPIPAAIAQAMAPTTRNSATMCHNNS